MSGSAKFPLLHPFAAVSTARLGELRLTAVAALADYYAAVIRSELGDDPDHSGPEDRAGEWADLAVAAGWERLLTEDWRTPGAPALPRPGQRRVV
jgi:hypothetical protein